MVILHSPIGAFVILAFAMLVATPGEIATRPSADPAVESTAGRFLVATEALQDPNFRETVVYMLDHDRGGAMGLVVNRVLGEGPLGALLAQMGSEAEADSATQIRVFYGGPVEPGRGLVLHDRDYQGADTRVISPFAAVTRAEPVLEDIAAGAGPKQSLFTVGYAGWAPDQLERELAAGDWYVVDADPGLLFDDPVETRWQRALDRRSVDL